MCVACKWKVQEGNDVRSGLQAGVRATATPKCAIEASDARCEKQTGVERLLNITAGEEQKKGRREEAKWRCKRTGAVFAPWSKREWPGWAG